MAVFKQNYFQRRTKSRGPRTNNRINSLEVQVISSNGQNLGILGSIIFFAYMGYVMQYLKSYSNGIYLAISSMFVMNLFRTFEVTLVKNIIQYSILLPLFIFALDRLISAWQKKSFIN